MLCIRLQEGVIGWNENIYFKNYVNSIFQHPGYAADIEANCDYWKRLQLYSGLFAGL